MSIWEDRMMEKKNKTVSGITFTGDITVNGPMFDIHDNQHVHISHSGGMNQASDDDFECVNLNFFDEKVFCSYERQLALRNLFNEAFKRMDLKTGRDLVAIYIGYHFFKGELCNKKRYTDCIQDLENLLPGKLPKIREDEQLRSQRYKSYAESLGLECEKWFIEDGSLPAVNEWVLRKYKYNVDDERRKRIQKLSTDIYKGMKDIIK